MRPIEEIKSSCCDAQITTGADSTIVICTQCGEVPETLKIEKQTKTENPLEENKKRIPKEVFFNVNGVRTKFTYQ